MAENKKKKRKRISCSIGGQAVLEGVMMMGKTCMATAVRDSDGQIQIESSRIVKSPSLARASRIPFVRGVVNMFSSLVRGTKTLMRSAAVYGEEEGETGRLEKWLAEKCKVSLMSVVSTISVIVGVVLAIGLFMLLPQFVVGAISDAAPALKGSAWYAVLLGVFKLIIFFIYLGLILIMKDIRRLYMYHGAEHKTITCYELGLPLTPENVMKCSRLHPRCGTSFLFVVIAVNILVISLVYWALNLGAIENKVLSVLARIGIEIVLLPVIAGISYEILKLVARFDNPVANIFKLPGYFIQKVFTTREPDEQMVEVAIASFTRVLEMDADPEMVETSFITGGILSQKLKDTKAEFAKAGIDESDAEWIYSIALGIKRSELASERVVTQAESKKIAAIVKERLTGRPLWYIIGDVEFFGCKLKVDERALIPRPETEELAEIAAKTVESGDKVLDMCTGSGCLAVSVAKACAGKNISVTAADISDAALMLAAENAELNGVTVHCVRTDLFENIRGRFNLIMCNPPYIKSADIASLDREVKDFEPRIALDGGADGLDYYRRLAKDVNRYVARGGMLILEVGEDQAEDVLKLFEKRDYAIVLKDLEGKQRFLKIAF